MFNRILLSFRAARPHTIFLLFFGAVLLVAFAASVLLAFLAAEQYSSSARIRVSPFAVSLNTLVDRQSTA